MGRKVSDGKAVNRTLTGSEVIEDYELYRVDGWNGVAIGTKGATEDKTLAFEADTNAIYSVGIGASLDPDPGDLLFWADPSTFQSGKTNLVASPSGNDLTDGPCFLVTKAKNDADECQGRVLNGHSGGTWS